MADQTASRPVFTREQPLFYLHVPKVGGSSIEAVLEDQFGVDDIERFDIQYGPEHLNKARPARACYYGHVTYAFRDRLPAATTSVAFFRDPIERALSTFYFWKALGKDALRKTGLPPEALLSCDVDLPEFIARAPHVARLAFGSQQIRFLAAKDPLLLGPESKESLDRSLEILPQLGFVGLTERMDESVAAMCRLFGWYVPQRAPHANRTPKRSAFLDFDAKTRATLQEWTALDAELYRRATARYEALTRHLPSYPPLPATSSVNIPVHQPMCGWGWDRRYHERRGWIRWTRERAGIEARLVGGGDLRVTVQVARCLDRSQLNEVGLYLNDQPLQVRRSWSWGLRPQLTAIAPNLPHQEATYRLEIRVPRLVRPCDVKPSDPDHRPLGLAISRISMGFQQSGILGWLGRAA